MPPMPNILQLLTLVASLLHPGAETRHADLLRAISEGAASVEEAVDCLVWAEHESRMGEALGGRRWDSRAYGVMQIRDRPELETDVPSSVRAWLAMRRAGAVLCGDDGLAVLSSGACNRGTRLSAQRRAEARWWEMVGRKIIASAP